jgi:ppGpp synthetase/RelA/SpoT-type nucleotidyltranferase
MIAGVTKRIKRGKTIKTKKQKKKQGTRKKKDRSLAVTDYVGCLMILGFSLTIDLFHRIDSSKCRQSSWEVETLLYMLQVISDVQTLNTNSLTN